MILNSPPPDSCVPLAHWVCANFKDDFNFWEVGVSVLTTAVTIWVSLVTIALSLLLAWWIARVEVRRDQRSKGFARRVEAINAFGDLGATILNDARKEDGIEFLVHSHQHKSRISIYSRTTEAGMHDWMRAKADELVKLVATAFDSANATGVMDLAEAIEFYHQRLEDLRYWPASKQSWGKYIEEASQRPGEKDQTEQSQPDQR